MPLAVGDEVDVLGEGTGHNGLGVKLADRLDDGDPDNDVVIVPIVETLPDSCHADGKLDGNVRIVSFAAVRLEAIIEATVPDPKHPYGGGKTIDIELLVGIVVRTLTSGTAQSTIDSLAEGPSVGIPLIMR